MGEIQYVRIESNENTHQGTARGYPQVYLSPFVFCVSFLYMYISDILFFFCKMYFSFGCSLISPFSTVICLLNSVYGSIQSRPASLGQNAQKKHKTIHFGQEMYLSEKKIENIRKSKRKKQLAKLGDAIAISNLKLSMTDSPTD